MLKNVKYILTTHSLNKMPQDDLKEYVIVGRSNVGKSTFINAITNNKSMAKISSKPGKTKAISFFSVDDKYRIVDIPGYGYAKVSKQQKMIFGEMIDDFFSKRKNIFKIILLLDIRRGMTKDDEEMVNYFIHSKIPFIVIGTKLDKVNQSIKIKFEREIQDKLGTTPIMYSSVKKTNLNKIELLFGDD